VQLLPAPEGTYTITISGFLSSSTRSGFGGVLGEVDAFAKVTPAAGATPALANPAEQVQQLDVQFNNRAAAEAKAAGAAPIRVKLPVNGKLYKLEKILALPQDKLFFTVQYEGWKVAR